MRLETSQNPCLCNYTKATKWLRVTLAKLILCLFYGTHGYFFGILSHYKMFKNILLKIKIY
jgi:hypothetical protein